MSANKKLNHWRHKGVSQVKNASPNGKSTQTANTLLSKDIQTESYADKYSEVIGYLSDFESNGIDNIVKSTERIAAKMQQEGLQVKRSYINRPATEADFAAFKKGTVEMIESAEVPVVNTEARVAKEVSLGKEVNERSETICDTVRKTEIDVENIVSSNTISNETSRFRDNS